MRELRSLFSVFTALAAGQLTAQGADSAHTHMRTTRHVEIGLLTGYAQGRYGFGELGLSANIWGTNRHPYSAAAYLATEVRVDRPGIFGVKAGVFATGGFAMGAQAIYYTDGTEGSFVLRPEYGIGIFKFKLTYGYNFRITNKDPAGINSHMLNLVYCFRLKRLKGDDHFKQ